MIQLFNIPTYNIDTAQFSNLLHDKTVTQFEERFAEYVGAKYAVSFNSATSAIFLIFDSIVSKKFAIIPSLIPPVVANAIVTAGGQVSFCDNVNWVGDQYCIATFTSFSIIDSAQRVDRNQFANHAQPNDLMIFSFYPTKPIGSCDGGMVVSNDKDKIDRLREMSMNGMSPGVNNWERKINRIGYKMYMNSLQAYIANENLNRLEEKKKRLAEIREQYNRAFGPKNTSHHLYRLYVDDNKTFIEKAKQQGIVCGIHYEALHLHPIYETFQRLDHSERHSRTRVSIPFHENLSSADIQKVIKFVYENTEIQRIQ